MSESSGPLAGQRNVLGTELQPCSYDPMTGYYRSGCCENRGDDPGASVGAVYEGGAAAGEQRAAGARAAAGD